MWVSNSDVYRSQKVSIVKGGDNRLGRLHVEFMNRKEDIECFEIQNGANALFGSWRDEQIGLKSLEPFCNRNLDNATLTQKTPKSAR